MRQYSCLLRGCSKGDSYCRVSYITSDDPGLSEELGAGVVLKVPSMNRILPDLLLIANAARNVGLNTHPK